MNFEISESLITTLSPILSLHDGIGLLIVAVFMFLRSDSVLKLFGIGVGLLGISPLSAAVSTWLQPADAVQFLFTFLGGFVSVASVIMFVIVGSSDYRKQWRRVAIGAVIVWAVVLTIMGPLLGTRLDDTTNSDAYDVLITLTTVWFLVGWFIAFLKAAHIAVKHSHGEPYRSILLAAMSVYAVSVVAQVIASENDQLHYFNWILTTAMVLVMWIAVVIHERKEIALEHQNTATKQL